MIEEVKKLLNKNNVSVAVVMDDAYDTRPFAEDLSAAPWNSFFDDLTDEEEGQLRNVLGNTYDEQSVTELITTDVFVRAVWDLRDNIAASHALFEAYRAAQAQKCSVLEPLLSLLRDGLKLTCHSVGREANLAQLDGQVIFLDLYMGFHERKEAIQRAAYKMKELIKAKPDDPPSVILLSESSELERLAPQLRDDAQVLGCQFRWISKTDLKDSIAVAERIYDLVVSHTDAVTLNQCMLSWERALSRSKDHFMKSIRSLDLSDYANVKALILESEGEPLGDYVLDIYDLHLHSVLEGDQELVAAAQKLTSINWDNYPPAHFIPSDELNTIMDGALFHNQVRTDSYLKADHNRMPRLGEVILGPKMKPTVENSAVAGSAGSEAAVNHSPAGEQASVAEVGSQYAYVVLSQACDLQHGKTDRLLLLRGDATKYSWKQHDKSVQYRTPIMRLDAEEYSVVWNTAAPETWLLNELPDRIAQGYRRARIMRMPFALELQQAFIGRLGRVGTLAALPTRYAAGLRIFMRTAENKAALLVESTADQDDAICLVGRTGNRDLMEWLLLSRSVRQKLRLALADRDATSFPNETPSLKTLRSDPAFMRELGKGLIMRRVEKGSRPFENTSFDVVQILANLEIVNGDELTRSYRSLLVVVDFENVS